MNLQTFQSVHRAMIKEPCPSMSVYRAILMATRHTTVHWTVHNNSSVLLQSVSCMFVRVFTPMIVYRSCAHRIGRYLDTGHKRQSHLKGYGKRVDHSILLLCSFHSQEWKSKADYMQSLLVRLMESNVGML